MTVDRLALNLRYLLWRRKEPREDWVRALHAQLPGWSAERVRMALADGTQDYGELQDLAEALGITEEELTHADLIAESGVDVLLENLRYLAETLARGGKAELAESLGRDATTISKWLRGQSHPPVATQAQIAGFFGLPAGTDLATEPVFLSMDPISVTERREWLHARVDLLRPEEIAALFPALRRLLRAD